MIKPFIYTDFSNINLFNALAITTLSTQTSEVVETKSFKNATLTITNTHDQAITITVKGSTDGTKVIGRKNAAGNAISLSVASGEEVEFGPVELGEYFAITAAATTAPLSGSITVDVQLKK